MATFLRRLRGTRRSALALAVLAAALAACSGGGDGGEGALDDFFNTSTFDPGVPPAGSDCPFQVDGMLRLELESATNDTVTFLMRAEGVLDLYNVYFDLVYASSVLRYVSGSIDPAFAAAGEGSFQAVELSPGRLIVGATRLGAIGGVSGNPRILRLTFAIEGAGQTGLTFDPAQNLGGNDPAQVRILDADNFCGGVLRID